MAGAGHVRHLGVIDSLTLAWTAHGDLRVPHFVGLQAMQALPLVTLLVRERRRDAVLRTVARTAVSYGALCVLRLVQALGGEPLSITGRCPPPVQPVAFTPHPVMLALVAGWATLSVAGLWPASGAWTTSRKAAAVY